ncbi:MAG TPA: ribulose bisphosphate carboxylase small subunit [Terriglobales bacterium]|nr:ribulose bisphosphate carboxylase small subunit [Terriglobales bacterium]
MRLTQGTFSYLPDLSEAEIKLQMSYCLDNGWPISIEHTDDPHPRNAYWEMWGLPMFDASDLDLPMQELKNCRRAFPSHYIKVNGYDRRKGRQTTMLSFIVYRPREEPGFSLERTEGQDRRIHYTIRSKAQLAGPAGAIRDLGDQQTDKS